MSVLPLVLLLAAAHPAGGGDLVAHYQCNRCHDGAGEPARLESHCVRCHDAIDAGTWNAPKAKMDAWRENLISFRAVPSLADLSGFRREWVASFLLAPRDVRPNLRGMMPRFAMTRAEAERIAAHLVPDADDEEAPVFGDDEVRAGRAAFADLECGSCHDFSGVVAPARRPGDALSKAQLLAPDLSFTRARLRPSFVVGYLRDPRAHRKTALMPAYDLPEPVRRRLTAFVFAAELEDRPEPPPPSRLPILKRRVGFAEVKREVFEKACQHCHANPERSFGDGGPGNTGGFGYAGRGLSLASYREVMSGSRDDAGRRRSVFEKDETGTPRIIRHLLARREEVRGREVEGVLGMPMALPPLSPAQIQLLESWIAQGRPSRVLTKSASAP